MQTVYMLDDSCRILAVGGDWDKFALENDGSRAMADNVVGRELWDFISDWDTSGFLNAIFFWVRRVNRPFETTYRCDSPDVPRMFRMRIEPQADGQLNIINTQVDTRGLTGRNVVPIRDCVTESRCSMCCRFQVGGAWLEPFASPDVRYFPKSHSICPECREKVQDARMLRNPVIPKVVSLRGS